jgi:Transposase zinc-ribbon domain/ISXO2-like transposase domain
MRDVDARESGDIDVPDSHLEFEARFGSEVACRAYLERVRWPDGFVCPNEACGGQQAGVTARGLHRCAACGRQTSVAAGTIFAGTRKPLRAWFEVLWLMTGEGGVSAEEVRTVLGLGSYQTAWVWLHKLRRAMAMEALERLSGIVELGVISLVSVEGSERRKAPNPPDVVIALEVDGPMVGRVRLASVPNSGPVALERFVEQAVAPGATIRTTMKLRPGIAALGFELDPATMRAGRDSSLPHLADLAGQLDYWIVRTHHAAIRRPQVDFYLAEFAFRFNQRASSPVVRFERLLEVALAAAPMSARALVGGTGAVSAGATGASTSGRDRAAPEPT